MRWQEVLEFTVEAEQLAYKMAPDDEQAGDPVGLAKLLANLRLARLEFDAAIQYVETTLANAMVDKTMVIEGLGEIERHTGAQRKEWQSDELSRSVEMAVALEVLNQLSGMLVDSTTGEPIDLVALTHDIVTEYRRAATPSWKVTGLRAMHIDPGDYCTTTWGRKTVQTPKIEQFLED
jgi:hypothetical protein